MKKFSTIALSILATFLILGALSGCTDSDTLVLNVYNWGEYISDGRDGSFYTEKEFEKWYEQTYGQKIKVNYDTYASNEDMYAKLSSGAVSYDVIIPSDYMIARLANENMLAELDFENIPNYKNIDDRFKNLYYDKENKYTVPYAYGIVGIIYDANKIDPKDATDWDLMWNEKYSGSILQFNNSRDAFGTAMYKLGLDVNTSDKAVWDKAYEELVTQKPLRYGLVMDEIFNLMQSGEASIGAYYAGDYFTMRDSQADNVDLKFFYPENTNYYMDAMCIPSCCRNKKLAEIFINYMLSEEPAVANAEFTYYASPNKIVYTNNDYIEYMGDAMDVIYGKMDDFAAQYNKNAYHNLDTETLKYINSLWENVKIN